MERKPDGERVLACILGFVTGICAVVIIVIYCRDISPVTATVGTIADRRNNFDGRRVTITNAGMGKRVGRFLYFDTLDQTRHCVVISLAAEEIEPECTTFRALVVGVMDERIPGCDHDPPFLYVIQARPVTE